MWYTVWQLVSARGIQEIISCHQLCAGDQYQDDEHGDDYQWAQWMKTAFEKVTAHVGRVYVIDTTKPEEMKDPHNVERCVGTVGLMDVHGESICALHCVYHAVEHKHRYRIDVLYPNYHKGALAFNAKPKTMDEDVDLCVLEPVTPLKKPNLPTTYLDLATDAREDDVVYCFFFPKDPLKHETPQVIRHLIRPEKAIASRSNPRQPAESPTIISGTVCFSEWMQGVVTYERLPDANGGVIVSRSGRVKGIHVKAFTCGELRGESALRESRGVEGGQKALQEDEFLCTQWGDSRVCATARVGAIAGSRGRVRALTSGHSTKQGADEGGQDEGGQDQETQNQIGNNKDKY